MLCCSLMPLPVSTHHHIPPSHRCGVEQSKYPQSEAEKDDVFHFYTKFKGDMSK